MPRDLPMTCLALICLLAPCQLLGQAARAADGPEAPRIDSVVMSVPQPQATDEAVIVTRVSAAAQDRAPREIFVSETRLETLKQRVEQRTEPTYSAWLDLQSRAEKLVDRQPHAPQHWYVPGYYRDATGHSRAKQGLQDDANAVYELALCWRMTGDQRYARSAVRVIDGWVNTVQTTSREDDSTLSFSYHFPAMIFGADLLASWPGFSIERQDAFRRDVLQLLRDPE